MPLGFIDPVFNQADRGDILVFSRKWRPVMCQWKFFLMT